MSPDQPRVVLIGLDGLPFAAVTPERTPLLWSLGETGGRAANGGMCALPSSTYPGFASLLTGCLPGRHGVRVTREPGPARQGLRIPGGWAGARSVQVPTLFHACRAAGVRSAAIQGDHQLHAVLETQRAADVMWPPDSRPPDDAELDGHGYPVNMAVRGPAIAAMADHALGFTFVHLNEADTLGHESGPAHPLTLACAEATDRLLGELFDALAPDWERSIVVIVSDHDMEPRTEHAPIRLLAAPGIARSVDDLVPDGGAALLRLREGVTAADVARRLNGEVGIADVLQAGQGLALAVAHPGFIFEDERLPPGGFHGGPATARTIAIVGGSHPAARALGQAIERSAPRLIDWAPTLAPVLGVELTPVDGVNLLRGGPGRD